MMRRVLTLVLGGGAGTRLYPLTKVRAKPAVPIMGKYRLIDIALANCINSDLRKIFVLTQYLSASLNRHIAQAYRFDHFSDGFVDIMAAEQRPEGGAWFQGTADAVRKNWATLEHWECDLILILPGDALYSMNYIRMVEEHLRNGAEITVGVNTVPQSLAHHFGLLAFDSWGRIVEFREKPGPDAQSGLEAPKALLNRLGLASAQSEATFLASMGVYLFNRDVLDKWMRDTSFIDFGKDIIPGSIRQNRVFGHVHTGYWEDIGTIEAFYRAHMLMLQDRPPFDFASVTAPVFSRMRQLPVTRVSETVMDHVLLTEGATIEAARLKNVVVGLRSVIGRGVTMEDTVMMGSDYYEGSPTDPKRGAAGVPLGIGAGSVIRRAIIDKNARIGRNVRILNEAGVTSADGEHHHIREGIVIVPKDAIVPDNTVI